VPLAELGSAGGAREVAFPLITVVPWIVPGIEPSGKASDLDASAVRPWSVGGGGGLAAEDALPTTGANPTLAGF